MIDAHLDHALAEEFGDRAADIHRLKARDPRFRDLLERNHGLWKQIQAIQDGREPAEDAHLHQLEKQRLRVLDDISAALARA